MTQKKKKGPSSDKAKKIIDTRDTLIAKGLNAETVGKACKGMYRCDKLADDKCLDDILAKLTEIGKLAKLTEIKKGGSSRRAKSRSRARSRSRSRSKPRRK